MKATKPILGLNRDGIEEAGAEDAPVLYFDPTTVLFVSLFLILFAFFAAMNVQVEERSSEVHEILAGLDLTFGGEPLSSPVDGSDQSLPVTPQGSLGQVADLVDTNFQGTEAKVSVSQDRLEVSLPFGPLFLDRRIKLSPSKELFLKDLAQVLSAGEGRYGVGLSFSEEELATYSGLQKAALIGATLSKYGLEGRALEITSHQGATQSLLLIVEREGA